MTGHSPGILCAGGAQAGAPVRAHMRMDNGTMFHLRMHTFAPVPDIDKTQMAPFGGTKDKGSPVQR